MVSWGLGGGLGDELEGKNDLKMFKSLTCTGNFSDDQALKKGE